MIQFDPIKSGLVGSFARRSMKKPRIHASCRPRAVIVGLQSPKNTLVVANVFVFAVAS